ncbi:C40 family peptidase [Viridibacillus sp. YIM B01967]|uniref:C40 family peptidase n=1 Tax=Viridibacillus soli TaxID=2798301 RepID=A0ABS1HC06_9BACL|nr:C40 family peptidase [Viridibacillus soli]MBK3496972.1 C40 family peptidase [Viridibacillus soli]
MTTLHSIWYCSVTVASVWTKLESVRDIDQSAIVNPVQLMKWLEALHYEERLDLCKGNRIQTQLLFGEPVIVEEIQGEWAKVISILQPTHKDDRGYPGWVPLVQLCKYQPSKSKGNIIVNVDKTQLWLEDGTPQIILTFNTILPVLADTKQHYIVDTPIGIGKILKQGAIKYTGHQVQSMVKAVQFGLNYLDLPYIWGGMSSYGYDCSGFTYNMAKACGIHIPRDAGDQATYGMAISKDNKDEWQVGDLLFFADEKGTKPVRHVGFYYGDGQMLHSPQTGKTVELRKLEGTIFVEELCAVRRYGSGVKIT